jgi:hypothetical protein
MGIVGLRTATKGGALHMLDALGIEEPRMVPRDHAMLALPMPARPPRARDGERHLAESAAVNAAKRAKGCSHDEEQSQLPEAALPSASAHGSDSDHMSDVTSSGAGAGNSPTAPETGGYGSAAPAEIQDVDCGNPAASPAEIASEMASASAGTMDAPAPWAGDHWWNSGWGGGWGWPRNYSDQDP